MKNTLVLAMSFMALTAVADHGEHSDHNRSEPRPSAENVSFTPVPALVADCRTEDFHVDDSPEVVIDFGYERGYSRRCLKVKPGAKVTIAASSFHPLQAMAPIAGAENPFLVNNAARTPQTRVLQTPGLYGYYCRAHSDAMGSGMAGAIWVTE